MQALLGLISGADSKTGARVEQYQNVRTTVKTVEITVERADAIKIETTEATSHQTSFGELGKGTEYAQDKTH